MTTKRILFLDGLRGFLSLWIKASQLTSISFEVAVDATFMISAFLITMKLVVQVQELLRLKSTPKDCLPVVLKYTARRISRIIPTLAIVACALTWFSPKQKFQTFEIPTEYNFSVMKMITMQDLYPYFWPVIVIFSYYWLMPILAVLFVTIPNSRSSVMYSFIVAPLIFELSLPRSLNGGLFSHIWTFLAGSASGALYMRQLQLQKTSIKVAKIGWIKKSFMELVSFCCLFWISFMSFSPTSYTAMFDMDESSFPFITTPLALLLLKESLYRGPIAQFFETNVFINVGKISYPLFLVQPLVKGYFLHSTDNSSYILVVASIFFALLIHVFVELPHNLLLSTFNSSTETSVEDLELLKNEVKVV